MLRIIEESQEGMLRDLCKVSAVISNREEARGLQSASARGISSVCVPSKARSTEDFERELLEKISIHNPDYIVLAGFMKILSADFVARFPRRIINIHPADTQKHKGLNGYQWAFENKLLQTMITVHFVDENLDSGEIIAQETVDLQGVSSEEETRSRGLAVENQFYSKVLKNLLEVPISIIE